MLNTIFFVILGKPPPIKKAVPGLHSVLDLLQKKAGEVKDDTYTQKLSSQIAKQIQIDPQWAEKNGLDVRYEEGRVERFQKSQYWFNTALNYDETNYLIGVVRFRFRVRVRFIP